MSGPRDIKAHWVNLLKNCYENYKDIYDFILISKLKINYSKHSVSDFTEWILVSFGNRPVITANTFCQILLSGFWCHLIIGH